MAVHIRREADGLVRVYNYDYDGGWEDYFDYMWFHGGNYSCDCNRYLFFQRAAGEDDSGDNPCGETAYSIVKIVLPDGREIKGDTE